ncbi:magnesium transporter CorA family protein [Frankia sp. CNm7]|uniref:Magnesium transporter CorA family protein n=1 Tax=Frankia nepalensis TaxID=1836974 RepID=A0A937RK58_9ACTN|nr:magnesium transporter CorA family protein [Frankia nepalensis]MBL7502579.1 magnesium transporter CorA family protein [Frankia nepalensis]MBL7515485.1 magnesium transporter CorA family protein [Frankia nepalensis]MBL7517662.1 magnesium transporter CorA family protein [Frankia nepalensis]MBL7631752.1 magnesium transporter CorA family protein [Frankia nepalensis]
MGDPEADVTGRAGGAAGDAGGRVPACCVDPNADPTNRIGRALPRTRVYRAGKLEAEGFPVAQVSEYLEEPDTVVWLDLCAPRPDELSVISEELGLSSLAVEDAVSPRERPKLDRYPSHLFLNAYAVVFDTETGQLTTHEVGAFITDRALVTVRGDEGFDVDGLIAHWGEIDEDLAQFGVSYLVHGLLDFVVDQHFAAVQALDGEIEQLEDMLFDEEDAQDVQVQRRSYELRKSLVLLRRIVLPMREVVNSIMRRDVHLVDAEMMPYYQDVYDHVLRAMEWTESLRDLVTTILETNLTIQGNHLNLIMRRLTAWAAIIAVPTAITGFYGQNVPYPGFGQEWGFLVSLAVLAGCAGFLYVAFKRRGWL